MDFEMFNIETHYSIISKWWEKQKFPIVPIHALPKVGIMVKNNEKYIYAMFLYFTGSSIAWLEWIVGNPDVKPSDKRGGMQYGINTLSTIAKYNGVLSMIISVNNIGLVNSLKKSNFVITDKSMINMIKQL